MHSFKHCEERLSQLQLKSAEKDFLDRFVMCVSDNLADGPLTLDDCARLMNLHPSRLRRRIVNTTGLTPPDIICYYRLKRAMQLFNLDPRPRMFEVAQLCGFADGCHFAHVFRRSFGISPQKYCLFIDKNNALSI
ncbi:MAG: helix-turn-helix transcriptional regulator [Prevotella sp.]|nr:helix-turn-helix transcriptional regulator [Prevotella sp.]